MPYYRRWPYRRRRYRWIRRWRARRPLRRRYYRRYWVRNLSRKRKLPKLTLQEWQPQKINKTTVKGIYPLFICNKERISNNFIQFIDSVAPHLFPGGGGFSIIQFTLQGLFEQFVKATNWWTKSNCNMPLIRYRGCMLKLYKTEYFDYVIVIHRCYPLKATDMLYMSTQPSIMGMTKRCIHVPCKQNSNNKKPYKKIWIKPPTQMSTGWHFQQDLANFPLVVLTASATSFDRFYTHSNSASTTIGFDSLNTRLFKFHDWQAPPTTGYKPNSQMYVWGVANGGSTTPGNDQLKTLIYLGGTGRLQQGTPLDNKYDTYSTTPGYWGTIFDPIYLTGTAQIYFTNETVNNIAIYAKTHQTQTVSESKKFTIRTEPLIVRCRYNPFNDKAINNNTYVVSNLNDHTEWNPPPDKPDVQRPNLPLWLSTWGHLDFLRKGGIVSQVDINYIYVIKSNYIVSSPKLELFIPIDENFTQSPPESPYIGSLTASDELHFYPKVTFQIKTINLIASTGPGTIKLRDNQTCEAKFEYRFKFKVGGCPAPMEKVCNPSEQAKYPIPNFKQSSTSLQSPTTPIQTFLWDFDERRGLLTEKATKRIKKDYGAETYSLPITGTAMDLPPPKTIQSSDETSSEEEEAETTFQLLKLRHKQYKLRQRILKLMSQNIE
nr:MAG: ORF1 [TTV-like mini virus]